MRFRSGWKLGVIALGVLFVPLRMPALADVPELTAQERAWIEDHREVTTYFRGPIPPYILDNTDGSELRGLSIDYVRAVYAKVGLTSKFVSEPTVEAAKELLDAGGGIDTIPYIVPTPENDGRWINSPSYFSSPFVLYSRVAETLIGDLEQFAGKRISYVPSGTYINPLRKNYSSIEWVAYPDIVEALKAVAIGETDGYIGSLATGTYMINEYGLSNLKVLTVAPLDPVELTFAFNRQDTVLAGIVSKAIAAITPEEHQRIRSRWLAVRFEHGFAFKDVLLWAGATGAVFSVIVLFVYLSKRRLAAEVARRIEVEKSLRLTQHCVDNGPDMVIWINRDGEVLYTNKAAEKLFGYTTEEMLGMNVGKLNPNVAGEVWPRHWTELEKAGQTVFESDILRKDGSRVAVEIAAAIITLGGTQLNLAFVRDLSERKGAEALQRSMVNALADGIVMRSADGEVQFANEAAGRILERDVADLKARGWPQTPVFTTQGEVILPGDIPIMDTLRTGQPQRNVTLGFPLDSGATRWINVNTEPVIDPLNGKVVSAVASFADVTAALAAERELIDAKDKAEQASQAKSLFLANMSHEIRTPLNAVIGFAQIIQRAMYGPIAPEYAESAGHILYSGRHLLEVINQILDMSKIEAGKMELAEENVDIESVIAEVVDLLRVNAEERRISLVNRALEPHALVADRTRVKQALFNVIGNAIKYTECGDVVITHRIDDRGHAVVIKDAGIGMTADQIKIALEPFGRVQSQALARRQEGTGLGLSLTQKIMELHGGRIDIHSAPGAGTEVELLFPAARTAPLH